MQTWKFSIKPEGISKDAFEKCKELGFVGIGWSQCYEDKQPKDYEEAKSITNAYWNEDIKELRTLYEKIKLGDHLWLHKNGHYYLCIAGDKQLFARDICGDFRNYDLGHAISAQWIQVPNELICGSIQRGTIAQRMIQKINKISKSEIQLNQYIAKQLLQNPKWLPKIDLDELYNTMLKLDVNTLFSIMSPDDFEDIVAGMLQSEDWILLKSTCFRSKPKFEYSLINSEGKYCVVQVKSGRQQLPPQKYIQYLNANTDIVLFSNHPIPYPGDPNPNIRCIEANEIYHWMTEHSGYLSIPLKMRILLSSQNE